LKNLPLGQAQKGRIGPLTISVGLHVILALGLLALKIPEVTRPATWVEMVVAPEPVPEPPPPVPTRVAVAAPVRPQEALEPVAEPEPTPAVRRVHGLSSSSFLKGSGTGLSVRAGNSRGVGASSELMGLDEAGVAWTAVSAMPKCRKPDMSAPQEVRASGIEGTVEVLLDVYEHGTVVRGVVVESLSPEADAACLAAWKQTRCDAAKMADAPVAVREVPFRCTFQAMD
jgi:outer membrane biosynthesis protein TonB